MRHTPPVETRPLLASGDGSDGVSELPQIVRESVPLEDDTSIPVATFRYFVLSVIFVVPGAFIDTMNSYRTTSAAYAIFFVQIAGHWCGKWLARVLPQKKVTVFGHAFQLNPGPWTIKETALLTITANSGATGNLATNALSLAELHFNEKVNPITAILFMFAIVFVGYAYAAIAKDLILYDPQFTWPKTLMQTTLLQTQANNDKDSTLGHKQMKVFFFVLGSIAVWEFFPEFVFPMTSSLALLCWMAPHNSDLNFVGSGLGGMGLMNFSLDWANVTSEIMLFPYWIQVIQFVGFVVSAWILIPLAKYAALFPFKHGLMSNSIFMENGEKYPTKELLTEDFRFNATAYEIYGPANLGYQRVWNVFFDYAAYISGIVWVVTFGYDRLRQSFAKIQAKRAAKGVSIHHQYTDKLNMLQAEYPEVPGSWYVILFLVSFGILAVILLSGQMFMPWWCCVVALVLGSLIVTPLSWLYALSSFQLPIGTFNELFYGYLVQNSAQIHPASGTVFGSIAGDAWYRAQYHLDCMKLGFYIHLPPKAVFLAQVFGELIGIPVNYLALRWVLDTKSPYLKGELEDPLHQWAGQTIESIHTNAIQYVVLGPSRLFSKYPLLPLGFVAGAVAPVVLFHLHKRYPRANFDLWNTTVFFSSMSRFYGNISTGYLSKFIGGTVTMYWAYNYKHQLWKKYNYVLAAAFDTGYNLSVLLIFVLFSVLWQVKMPEWWGNNGSSIERCFAK